MVSELLEQNALGRLVGLLGAGLVGHGGGGDDYGVQGGSGGGGGVGVAIDGPLTASLLRVVCYLASEPRALMEFYQVFIPGCG